MVEAAIDIDADYLFTEIAPLDALIQRMGRILRRYSNNFQYDGEPNINILLFKKGNESGNNKVYSEELIELTKIVLLDLLENETLNDENIKSKAEKYYQSFLHRSKSKKNKEEVSTNSFLLSEYEKYLLVNKLYELMMNSNGNSKYLNEFHKTLDLLDAGYLSDKKSEAQKKFRPMVATQVISRSLENKFKDSLIDYLKNYYNSRRPYTMFKEKVISEFVVNINGLQNPGRENSIAMWIMENLDIPKDQKKRLCSWTENIFFVPEEYSSQKGMDKKINQKLLTTSNLI